MNEKSNDQNILLGIAGIIGGTSAVIVTLFAIFTPEQLSVAVWIVAPLCLMGIALGALSVKASTSAQKK